MENGIQVYMCGADVLYSRSAGREAKRARGESISSAH